MKLEHAEKIVEYIEDVLGESARLYENYTGRGMGTRSTAGVVTDSVFNVGVAVGALGLDIHEPRQDSLGMDTILY